MLDTMTRRFADRHEAGRALAERLRSLATEDPVVLGLARGGVPVAYEVAQALGAPLDVLVVRKIGAPGNPELGIGAIAEGDVRVLNRDVVSHLMVSGEELEGAASRAGAEVDARVRRYRDDRPPLAVQGRTVIVVDDGLATGGTARAALRAVRARHPRRLVLAVPVGAPDTVRSLRGEADEVICLLEPKVMYAVGVWYRHFEPTSDQEVTRLLAGEAADPPDPPDPPGPASAGGAGSPARSEPRWREVRIPDAKIVGDLVVPQGARGLVVFAHGSGSSRFSPRNRRVAADLQERGLATLLLDLLRPHEERDRANVFDIALLAHRLVAATRWARTQPDLAGLAIGYFGASTGAAAALSAAALLGDEIGAVVSRGGRPDLARDQLARVRAPVLLIVGGSDRLVLELNAEARRLLRGPGELAVVPGATHLFEEPGALEEVSRLAGEWFVRHLSRTAQLSARP